MPTPTLVVVSGPPGSGKTTLAHALADAIACPAICRDEIKEGMTYAEGAAFEGAPGDPLTQRTFPLFFEVLRVLVEGGVTVVAEAAFQNALWRRGLDPLLDRVQLRIVRCRVDAAVSYDRAVRRASTEAKRRAHGDSAVSVDARVWAERAAAFEHVSLEAPSVDVDTTDGYTPGLGEIVAFVRRPA